MRRKTQVKINQIYSIINTATAQMTGEPIEVNDLKGLIALGDTVLSSNTNKDNFLNALVDRIGKTIISNRQYSAPVKSILSDSFSFGAILQKLYTEPIPATTAPHWDLVNGSSVDQYKISKPSTRQKLFSVLNSWQLTVTIPDHQLKSAFTSAEQMAAFIDSIFTSIQNSLEVDLEALGNTAYANFIGEKIKSVKVDNKSGLQVVNLLADYNTLVGGTPLTAASALTNSDFLKYASKTINQYIKRLERMSTLFNAEEYHRFTPANSVRVSLLSDYVASTTSYLSADTYHNELVALPNYREVQYWQGSGDTYSFEDCSSINIVTSSGYNVEQSGIIGLVNDVEAIALMCDNRRSNSAYNSNGEYTNFFEKADVAYLNDLSENGIVFIIADEITVPTLAV